MRRSQDEGIIRLEGRVLNGSLIVLTMQIIAQGMEYILSPEDPLPSLLIV